MHQGEMGTGAASGWRRFDDGFARAEAALAIGMLLLMLVVAFAQAFLRNLTNLGWGWANAALERLDWADFILSKGTLWLAFLGASLAVHGNKHIAIDIVPRLVGPKARMFMRGMVGIVGCLICVGLATGFWGAVMINGEERPAEVEILTSHGDVHVCDATSEELRESVTASAGPYCYVRRAFAAIGVHLDTPGSAFQLIVPVMFAVMALRMLVYGFVDFGRLKRGELDDDGAPAGIVGVVDEVAHDLDDKQGGGRS